MNKTLQFIVILLVMILPALYLMVKLPLYPSHDGLFHIERINDFHLALISGQFPVRIMPNIAGKIGYPLFVVNYHLPYYFAEIFMFTINNPIIAFKSVISVSYILSAVFAFLLFRETNTNLASLTGALVFSYLPYRFANIYTRGALGESTALMFVPLVILALHKIKNHSKWSQILLIISVFGLITTHTLIFILFSPFFFLYILVFLKPTRKFFTQVLFAAFLGITLSSFQLIPAIFEKHFTKFNENFLTVYSWHFLKVSQILRLPFPGTNLSTPFQAGASALFISLLSFVLLILKRKKYLVFFLAFIITSIFLSTQYSKPIWSYTPINYLTFPWRFLSVITLSCAFLSVFLVENTKHKLLLAAAITTLTIFASRHYFLKPTQYESTPTSQEPSLPNEFETKWSTSNTYKYRPFITPSEKIIISNFRDLGTNFSFDIKTQQSLVITIRRLYFPGWHVNLDGKDQQIIIKDGLISINLPAGANKVYVYFEEDLLRKTANLITLLSFVVIIYLYRKPTAD